MSDDPYRSPPTRFFKSSDVFVALDQVIGVAKSSKYPTSTIKIVLRNGSSIDVHWVNSVTAAADIYDQLINALEELPR